MKVLWPVVLVVAIVVAIAIALVIAFANFGEHKYEHTIVLYNDGKEIGLWVTKSINYFDAAPHVLWFTDKDGNKVRVHGTFVVITTPLEEEKK